MGFLLFCGAMILSSAYKVPKQTIDSAKSSISFSISNLYVNTVEGNFMGFEGDVKLDLKNLGNSSFEIKIPVSNINTENKDRDNHLQAEEYFNSSKFPFIIFTSTNVISTAKGLDISGKLNIKGITKTITIPFKYETTKEGYLLIGNFQVDRYDFKVGSEGSFGMGRMVDLKIQCLIKNN